MSSDANELYRRRTAAWLELDESDMIQSRIGKLLGVSQATVSRAIGIANGRLAGPYTDDMNGAIDKYIRRRDEQRAKCERERQEVEDSADEDESVSEEESRRERLWDWVDGELSSGEQEAILRAYRLRQGLWEPFTEDEELAILARNLELRPGYPDPPVEITVELPPLRAVSPPADPKRVAQPQAPPRATVVAPRQAASPPVRRSASPPARRRRRAASSPSGFDSKRLAQLLRSLSAALAVVVGILLVVYTDVPRELWTAVSETLINWISSSGLFTWGPIALGLLCIVCAIVLFIVPVRRDEPAKGALWIMKLAACATLCILMMEIVGLALGPGGASFTD